MNWNRSQQLGTIQAQLEQVQALLRQHLEELVQSGSICSEIAQDQLNQYGKTPRQVRRYVFWRRSIRISNMHLANLKRLFRQYVELSRDFPRVDPRMPHIHQSLEVAETICSKCSSDKNLRMLKNGCPLVRFLRQGRSE